VATDIEKKIEDMLIRFDRMYERDGHTHTDTHRMTIYTVFQKKFTLLLFAIAKSDVDRFQ